MSGNNLKDCKEKLDRYLQLIPNEPKINGYTPSACDPVTAKASNSLLFQSRKKIRNPGS